MCGFFFWQSSLYIIASRKETCRFKDFSFGPKKFSLNIGTWCHLGTQSGPITSETASYLGRQGVHGHVLHKQNDFLLAAVQEEALLTYLNEAFDILRSIFAMIKRWIYSFVRWQKV